MIEPTTYHVSRFSAIMVMKDNGKVTSYEVYNKVSGLMVCEDYEDSYDPIDFGSYNAAKTTALELKNHYQSLGGY
jgi:hypothetical protein